MHQGGTSKCHTNADSYHILSVDLQNDDGEPMTDFDKKETGKAGSGPSVKEVVIDFSKAPSWDTDALGPALERSLLSRGLLKEEYLYSAFHPDMLSTVRSLGSARAGGVKARDIPMLNEGDLDPDIVYCVAAQRGEDKKVHLERHSDSHLFDFLEERRDDDQAYIAVYARIQLESEDSRGKGFTYVRAGSGACRFSDPTRKQDALVAIVKVKFPAE